MARPYYPGLAFSNATESRFRSIVRFRLFGTKQCILQKREKDVRDSGNAIYNLRKETSSGCLIVVHHYNLFWIKEENESVNQLL